MRRLFALLAAVALAATLLAPALADARAGGRMSMGSRGFRTYSAPPVTRTAPGPAAPFEQSTTPRPSYGAPAGPVYGGGRRFGGFGAGLLGGLLGAGIGGLLFGHGFFGGGGFGFIGLLLQLVILYFVVRWLFRLFARPAMVGPGIGGMNRFGMPASGMAMGGGQSTRPVTITPDDYNAFEHLLQQVQAAWSTQDIGRLRSITTAEMAGYFGQQLSDLSRQGQVNTVTDVVLDQGDLSEAWSEGDREYATVAMRFSMVDVTRDSSGRVVDGDPSRRSSATELWTFVRPIGGRWVLSAIQQTR